MNHFRNRRVSITVLLGFIVLSGLALLAFATDYDASTADSAECSDGTSVVGTTYTPIGTYNGVDYYGGGAVGDVKVWLALDGFWYAGVGDPIEPTADFNVNTISFKSDSASITAQFSPFDSGSDFGTHIGSGHFTLSVAPTPTPTPTPAPEKPQVI